MPAIPSLLVFQPTNKYPFFVKLPRLSIIVTVEPILCFEIAGGKPLSFEFPWYVILKCAELFVHFA